MLLVIATDGTVNPMPEVTYDAVVDAYYAIPSSDRLNAWWIVGASLAPRLRGMRDTAAGLLWRTSLGEGPDRLIGRPIRIVYGLGDVLLFIGKR